MAVFFSIVSYAAEKQDISAIHAYHLKNGLTLLVKEDHRSPTVVNMVWYRVGSAYEPDGLTGISHALEHMMFQGTPSYPQGQFSTLIAAQGGEENAFTSQDYTAYFEKLDHTLLPLAFQLESDRMQHLSLQGDHFAKEIQVVREERRMRTDNSPRALAFERFMAAAYLSTPYHHPVIGWPDDLSHLTIEDVRYWYHTWYAPNNAIIVVVGDVQADQVLKQVTQYFGKIPSQTLPVFKPHEEPVALGPREVVVQTVAQQPMLMMGYITPTRVTAPQDWKPYALTVLNAVLSAGNSARLPAHFVRQAIASQIGAQYDMYSLYQTAFVVWGSPTKTHTLQDLKAALLAEIQQLQENPVSDSELQKVKNQLVAEKVYASDAIYEQASTMGMLASIGLPPGVSDTDIEALKAVTPEQIQQVAREFLMPNRLIVTMLVC